MELEKKRAFVNLAGALDAKSIKTGMHVQVELVTVIEIIATLLPFLYSHEIFSRKIIQQRYLFEPC